MAQEHHMGWQCKKCFNTVIGTKWISRLLWLIAGGEWSVLYHGFSCSIMQINLWKWMHFLILFVLSGRGEVWLSEGANNPHQCCDGWGCWRVCVHNEETGQSAHHWGTDQWWLPFPTDPPSRWYQLLHHHPHLQISHLCRERFLGRERGPSSHGNTSWHSTPQSKGDAQCSPAQL